MGCSKFLSWQVELLLLLGIKVLGWVSGGHPKAPGEGDFLLGKIMNARIGGVSSDVAPKSGSGGPGVVSVDTTGGGEGTPADVEELNPSSSVVTADKPIEGRNVDIDELQTDLNLLHQDLGEITRDIAELEGQITETNGQIAETDYTTGGFAGEIENLGTQFAQLTEGQEGKGRFNEQIKELQTNLNKPETQRNKRKVWKSELQR
jgi:chromosome segregation ATPase